MHLRLVGTEVVKCRRVVGSGHVLVDDDGPRASAERVLEALAVAVVSEARHRLRARLVVDVTLLCDFDQTLDLLALLGDPDVDVCSDLSI